MVNTDTRQGISELGKDKLALEKYLFANAVPVRRWVPFSARVATSIEEIMTDTG